MLSDYRKRILVWMFIAFTGLTQADDIHDPTAPKIAGQMSQSGVFNRAASVAEGEVSLQGIVNKKDVRMAIIAGQLLRKGDSISGYVINEVNRTYVVLSKSGTEKRLYVYEK